MHFSDRRFTFYEHSGVDFKGTARAVLVSLKGIMVLKEEVR